MKHHPQRGAKADVRERESDRSIFRNAGVGQRLGIKQHIHARDVGQIAGRFFERRVFQFDADLLLEGAFDRRLHGRTALLSRRRTIRENRPTIVSKHSVPYE
jgi:hypothetical protein